MNGPTRERRDGGVLIVEDDAAIGRLMRMHLEAAGLAAHLCPDGDAAIRLLREEQWDLVVLDRMLPGKSGMQLLRLIQGRGDEARLPVLMVTALGATTERVQGLEAGADDYLAKPFEPVEFVARVRALLRRAAPAETATRFGRLELDVEVAEARVDRRPLDLTALEFRLLHALARRPGRTRSREYLLDHVWGDDAFIEPRTVDVAVKRLRRALAAVGMRDCIETVRGVGYRFLPPGPDGT